MTNFLNYPEVQLEIGNNKYIRIYKSKFYKDFVVSISTGPYCKVILTRSMWNSLLSYISYINGVMGNIG